MDFFFNDEQSVLRQRIRKFGQEKLVPRRAEYENKDHYPQTLLDLLKAERIYPYFLPREYGGSGVSSVNICILREELCRACVASELLPIFQGLGSYPIQLFGTEEQKRKYLPPLANGDVFISFCLTESAAGSDVAGIQAVATESPKGWILNGHKMYVAHPDYSSFFIVFAKTSPELGGKGISAFIVEKSFPGVSFEKMHLCPSHPEGLMILKDCIVPRDNLLGPLNSGMKVALSNLGVFRTTVGAAAVGMAQSAYEESVAFAGERIAFKHPIAELQAIQFKLADMATQLEASRLMVYRAAWMADNGIASMKEASMAKLFATESAQRVIDEAVQIFGGRGVWEDSRVSFLYRAIRPTRIYEGSSEIQRLVIGREIVKRQSHPGLSAVVGGF